jgi:hypothetical protein
MSYAPGWAIETVCGDLLVRTVSDSRRAAIVNYLVTEHRVALTIFDTDENIEEMWRHYGRHAECRQVSISSIPSQESK